MAQQVWIKVCIVTWDQTNLLAVKGVDLVEISQEGLAENPLLLLCWEYSESTVITKFIPSLVLLKYYHRGGGDLSEVVLSPHLVDVRIYLDLKLWHSLHSTNITIGDLDKTLTCMFALGWSAGLE